jgi:hypothetical protein
MYVKVLSNDLKHKGFQYKEGLNIDTIPFNPTGTCKPGGLYFTAMENVFNYLHYGSKIADVEIPSNAKVYFENNKWKADKIILRDIRDLPHWHNTKFYDELFVYYEVSYVCDYLKIKNDVLKQYLIDWYTDILLSGIYMSDIMRRKYILDELSQSIKTQN